MTDQNPTAFAPSSLDLVRDQLARMTDDRNRIQLQLDAVREVVYDTTMDAVRGGGGCWPGARDFLQSCGVDVPTVEVTATVEVSFSARTTVEVTASMDAIEAEESSGSDEINVEQYQLADAVENQCDDLSSLDRYSVEVWSVESIEVK